MANLACLPHFSACQGGTTEKECPSIYPESFDACPLCGCGRIVFEYDYEYPMPCSDDGTMAELTR